MLFFIGIFWVHVRLKITNFVEFRLCYLQAVDVVGQAGKPKTITGFQTHTTPVLLAYGERAELATEECILLTSSEKIWLAKVCACVRVVCLGINHRRSISCDILSCTSLRAYPVTMPSSVTVAEKPSGKVMISERGVCFFLVLHIVAIAWCNNCRPIRYP